MKGGMSAVSAVSFARAICCDCYIGGISLCHFPKRCPNGLQRPLILKRIAPYTDYPHFEKKSRRSSARRETILPRAAATHTEVLS
jgi:hypothetical protein